MFARRPLSTPKRQRGVYALEWAVIFVVFFMLMYAILSFGLGFLVRESMQWAAEDGARAALQFKRDRQERKVHAKEVVQNNLGWLPAALRSALNDDGNFTFEICRPGNSATCTENMAANALECDPDADKPCLVQLSIHLPYAQHPFTPSLTLGLMEIAMPDLRASAQIVVDQKDF